MLSKDDGSNRFVFRKGLTMGGFLRILLGGAVGAVLGILFVKKQTVPKSGDRLQLPPAAPGQAQKPPSSWQAARVIPVAPPAPLIPSEIAPVPSAAAYPEALVTAPAYAPPQAPPQTPPPPPPQAPPQTPPPAPPDVVPPAPVSAHPAAPAWAPAHVPSPPPQPVPPVVTQPVSPPAPVPPTSAHPMSQPPAPAPIPPRSEQREEAPLQAAGPSPATPVSPVFAVPTVPASPPIVEPAAVPVPGPIVPFEPPTEEALSVREPVEAPFVAEAAPAAEAPPTATTVSTAEHAPTVETTPTLEVPAAVDVARPFAEVARQATVEALEVVPSADFQVADVPPADVPPVNVPPADVPPAALEDAAGVAAVHEAAPSPSVREECTDTAPPAPSAAWTEELSALPPSSRPLSAPPLSAAPAPAPIPPRPEQREEAPLQAAGPSPATSVSPVFAVPTVPASPPIVEPAAVPVPGPIVPVQPPTEEALPVREPVEAPFVAEAAPAAEAPPTVTTVSSAEHAPTVETTPTLEVPAAVDVARPLAEVARQATVEALEVVPSADFQVADVPPVNVPPADVPPVNVPPTDVPPVALEDAAGVAAVHEAAPPAQTPPVHEAAPSPADVQTPDKGVLSGLQTPDAPAEAVVVSSSQAGTQAAESGLLEAATKTFPSTPESAPPLVETARPQAGEAPPVTEATQSVAEETSAPLSPASPTPDEAPFPFVQTSVIDAVQPPWEEALNEVASEEAPFEDAVAALATAPPAEVPVASPEVSVPLPEAQEASPDVPAPSSEVLQGEVAPPLSEPMPLVAEPEAAVEAPVVEPAEDVRPPVGEEVFVDTVVPAGADSEVVVTPQVLEEPVPGMGWEPSAVSLEKEGELEELLPVVPDTVRSYEAPLIEKDSAAMAEPGAAERPGTAEDVAWAAMDRLETTEAATVESLPPMPGEEWMADWPLVEPQALDLATQAPAFGSVVPETIVATSSVPVETSVGEEAPSSAVAQSPGTIGMAAAEAALGDDLRSRIEETRRRIREELEKPFAAVDSEPSFAPIRSASAESVVTPTSGPSAPMSGPSTPMSDAPAPMPTPTSAPAPAPTPAPAPGGPGDGGPQTATTGSTGGIEASGASDYDAMRARIELTRNRLKAKAFDAMMAGESALLGRDDQEAGTQHKRAVSFDSEVEQTVDSTLREEDH